MAGSGGNPFGSGFHGVYCTRFVDSTMQAQAVPERRPIGGNHLSKTNVIIDCAGITVFAALLSVQS
jgi:hypothetical protein